MAMAEGTIVIDPVTGAETFNPVPPAANAVAEIYQALTASQNLETLFSGPTLAQVREQYANIARAVAKLVPHITTNGEVAVESVGGVQTGGGTSGPGTGTIA